MRISINMDIRKEIRAILMEVFTEVVPSGHFYDRTKERLNIINTRPEFDYNTISSEIELLKNINFPTGRSYAIKLKRFPVTYVSKNPEGGPPSIGDEVWAVVRDNDSGSGNRITTIFFRNSRQQGQVKDADITVNIKTLKDLYNNSEKKSDGTVDFSLNRGIKSPQGQKKKFELDLPVVELDGKNWYIDIPNEMLIYTKNTKKTIPIGDLDEKYFEKVIDSIEL
jgi:hypothetical protein